MRCLISCSTDVHLPDQLQRAMAAEAEATREARAKVRDESPARVLREDLRCCHISPDSANGRRTDRKNV